MSIPDTLELLYNKAKTGTECAVDDFFYEVLETISLAQGMNISPLVEKALWFKDNPNVSRKGLAYSMFIPGFVDSFYSRHSASIDLCSEASKIFEEIDYPDGVAMCSVVTGTNYRGLGNIELAIQYMTDAYRQLHKTDNILHFTIASGHQLADLYSEAGNFSDALAMCLEVLPLTQLPTNKKKMFDARLLNTMGNVYAKLGNKESALEYLEKALKQSEQLNQLPVTARVLTDIGGYYLLIRDFAQAISYNEQALAIRETLKLRNAAITNIINIANIQALQNKTDEAISTLLTGYAIAEELKVNAKMLQVLKKLSGLYEQKGDLQTSLAYYKQYNALLEEQNNELHEQKIRNIKLFIEAEQAVKQNEIIKAQKEEIEREKKRSDALLLNILPQEVAEELKNNDSAEARYFSNVTVLFTDFIDFTTTADRLTPKELVSELHACFKAFDDIMGKYDIEKIKTVGDAYLAVCGLPVEDPLHAEKVVNAALEIREFIKDRKAHLGDTTFDVRIGINSGSVVAGIVGVKKFAYDIWGDTVNTAARMEQNSDAGKINISETTHELVKDKFNFKYRGEIFAKGKGMLKMYYVL
jgi:class 3 adenylate cyclase/predicted negative regulator of RcsB-dependent stress response